MDRCALFVDAGYLLADGAMAVHGTRHRETVSWDYGGLLQLLGNLARERTGMPLLRCYWYEATVEGRRAPEHEGLADLPGLKLRLGRIRPGRREGVDTEIHRDLMTLARNGAIADAILVSGDEDLAQVITDAQDLGVRVTVVHVAVEGNWTISRMLRQECDDLIEIGSGHLRPYVNLLNGMNGRETSSSMSSPLSNGHAATTGNSIAPMQTGPHSGPPPQLSAPLPSSSMNSSMSSSHNTGNGSHNSSMGMGAPIHAAPTPPQSSAPSYLMPPPPPPQQHQHLVQQQPQQPQQQQSQHGPFTGPQPMTPAPMQPATPTLSDAVKAAHQEGQDFGESVARDAPALWLEAVLARKPRMPSDLEARLLQGSSLPIDFLLHDEVRHALRRGFWDALERSRR
ncbi:NYN domain-containing protein [Actinomadura scrupuli]|uniref:NYN domain-containing protein n=1 Tax=Actinomadura scrupuli TaxID=559629 RepID=UPI003D98EC92